MIAVVTGASGFIGRNLVGRLRDAGHEVRSLVRSAGRSPPDGSGSVVDFNEPLTLRNCPALEGADVVFHLAGVTRAASHHQFHAGNVTPTRHLLEALVGRRLAPRFVYVSSQAAAGPAEAMDRPVNEGDLPRPVEGYGRSKLEAERIVQSFDSRVPSTIVRPCSVFGPHDRDFARLFRLARRGFLVYPGVAAHWLSLLHVHDVVEGLVAAATETAAVGATFFLASDAPVQWRELGRQIESAVGVRARHVDIPAPLVRAAAHVGTVAAAVTGVTPLLNTSKAAFTRHPYWVCDNRRAKTALHWQATRSLPEAVRQTYLWYEQSGWLSGSSRAPAALG